MSGTLSIASPQFGFPASRAYSRPSSAFSHEAEEVRKNAEDVERHLEKSIALFGKKSTLITELNTLAEECSEDDWDGEGALPIDSQTIDLAKQFIRAIPNNIPLPELAPEPDGAVSLDWIQSRNRLFSLSIGTSNRLAYAWLDGTDRGHGVAYFDGEVIPPRILDGIKQMTNGSTSIRVA